MSFELQQWPLLAKEKHLRISHSSRSLFEKQCMRKFEMRKLFYHAGQKQGNVKSELGKALHEGYQTWLATHDENKAIWAYMQKYPINLCTSISDPSSLEAGFATLERMLASESMFGREIASVNCLDGEIRKAIEVPFEIDFEGFELPGGITVSYTGFIDTIMFDKLETDFAVLDIKTTSKKAYDPSKIYTHNEQQVPYGLVLEYMKQGEVEAFECHFFHCVVDVVEPDCQVFKFIKTKEDVNNWFHAMLLTLNKLSTCLQMGWFPRDFTGSTCQYGNWPCEYFDVCETKNAGTLQELFLGDFDIDVGFKKDTDEVSKAGRDFKPWIRFGIEVPK